MTDGASDCAVEFVDGEEDEVVLVVVVVMAVMLVDFMLRSRGISPLTTIKGGGTALLMGGDLW